MYGCAGIALRDRGFPLAAWSSKLAKSPQQVQRFWLSMMTPTLLGGWSLVREWGRIGSPGTVQARTDVCLARTQAVIKV